MANSNSGTTLSFEERHLPEAYNPDLLSRAVAQKRRRPYLAAIPAHITAMGFDIESGVLAEADDATQAIARFDAEFAGFPAPFSAVLLRSESTSSSQIENLTAGARAIAEAEIDERVKGNAPLIVRNVRAMEAAVALSDDISTETVIEMHRRLLEDFTPALVGKYRDGQVWIGGDLPHDATFVPPHHERVSEAMADLIAFTRRTDLPVLAQTAISHAQFETIHPFPNGNGRTGRVLVQAQLRNGGLLRHLAIPISSGLLTDLDSYFNALDAYRGGKVSPIVTVFSNASLGALANAHRLADDIRALQRDWDEKLSGLRSDATVRKLALLSIELPVLNMRVAVEHTGASQPAVSNALTQLADRGIIAQANSKQRNRIWVNKSVIEALDEFAARTGRRQQAGYQGASAKSDLQHLHPHQVTAPAP